MHAVPGVVEMELLVECFLVEVGKDQHAPAQERLAGLVHGVGRWKGLVPVMVVVHRQANLLEIVGALRPRGILSQW